MKRQITVVAILVAVIVLVAFGLHTEPAPLQENNNPPLVVLRVDDIQDYAFREAQLYLLEHCRHNRIPLSLAVIPMYFGEDNELVGAVKQTINAGSEVTIHGWEHENLSLCNLDEQKLRLAEAKDFLEETLNIKTCVLVPPMFMYNNDTITAMDETGYTIVSGSSEFHMIGWVSENILSIPATVELSNYSSNAWNMKSKETILSELNASIEEHGYAVVVTHPQEFIKNNRLNQEAVKKYEQIHEAVLESFSFNTIEGISQILP